MTREVYIERCLRQIYGGYIPADSSITVNLANQYLNDGVAVAAKQCYKESMQIEAVGCVNNSFYTTFKGLAVTKDENFLWRVTLPQIPIGIGSNEGISTMIFKDSSGQISMPVVWLSENQKSFINNMRQIPNKLLGYPEGQYVYVISTIILSAYTASATMISGGDSTDLSSIINVPDDYFPVITDYIKLQLGFERAQPADVANDGQDSVKTA
jgi:hypothetical protein